MEQEFIQLIQAHEALILKVCHVYCREPEDREDLYQDIVIQLWKSFPSFGQRSNVATWLYRVALNTAISRFRKAKKRPKMKAIDEQVLAVPLPDTHEHEGKLQRLHTAMERLNKIDRAIILLYLEKARYQEIAEIIGISESNVGFRINRIKQKLRDTLKNE